MKYGVYILSGITIYGYVKLYNFIATKTIPHENQ